MHLLEFTGAVANFSPAEKFALELWHGMTHELSLDSHRVRCLNARSISREIDQELRFGRIQQDEFVALCDEAREILSLDPIVPRSFPRHWAILEPLLRTPPTVAPDKRKDPKPDEGFRNFRFAIADLAAALGADYRRLLLEHLPECISLSDHERIASTVGALLSDLADQDWTLESLYRWVELFLREKKQPQHEPFSANLRFMLNQLSWGRQQFRVILRLSGSSRLAGFGEFGGFTFRPDPGFKPTNPTQQKFAGVGNLVAYAEASLEAVDFNSAAVGAREKFEDCLDLLGFNLEPAPLKIEERCYVERLGDKRTYLPAVRHLVPNPIHQFHPDAFKDFSDRMAIVLGREDIERDTRERLRAAIRHYRFGRDADSYKDKFLNWWMGLEFLAFPTSGDPIGQTVVKHASDALVQRFLSRLIDDLLRTVKAAGIAWVPEFSTVAGVESLDNLDGNGLLKLLQSSDTAPKLVQGFSGNPVASFRITRLAGSLQTPSKTGDMIEAHHNHLAWQMARLYRIRCCIVHGSLITFKLPLFAANLEFYLRELINVCLGALSENAHVHSLREVFQRAALAHARIIAELKSQSPSANAVRSAVLASPVLREVA